MKSLTIVSTYSPRYFPLPVTKSLETTAKNWPSHAKILVYPDNMSQTLPAGKEINEEVTDLNITIYVKNNLLYKILLTVIVIILNYKN